MEKQLWGGSTTLSGKNGIKEQVVHILTTNTIKEQATLHTVINQHTKASMEHETQRKQKTKSQQEEALLMMKS